MKMVMKSSAFGISLFLMVPALYADTLSLETITVEGVEVDDNALDYTISKKSEVLSKTAKGETLGDYLEAIPGIENASYGPAVGRPVVHGMEGYRVGILQGDMVLNDLSAMSQDHAVGLTPKASKRLELIKGPSTLLYGTYSGGVIRALGEEHEETLLTGTHGEIYIGSGTTGTATNYGAKVEVGDHNLSAFIHHFHTESDDYESAGARIKYSDTKTDSTHVVLGYQASSNQLIKLYVDNLEKSYAIPNLTPEETRIEMEQRRYGGVLHTQSLFDILYGIRTELQYSDYRHYETEGGRYDGLFDQEQSSLSTLFHFDIGSWEGESRISFEHNKLRVCHEHGECKEFSTPVRTSAEDGASLLSYYEDRGIPYAHGHPMPDTSYNLFSTGMTLKKVLEIDELSVATNIQYRKLKANPDNMQETWLMPASIDPDYYDEDEKFAASLSVGWWRVWSDTLNSQLSLSYLERLASSQELFWNGFHHATESYIIGDRDLDKERSLNIDLDVQYTLNGFETIAGLYYYHFDNYIYQAPLADAQGNVTLDPFHLSPVWQMREVGAKVYGATLEESYTHLFFDHKLRYGVAFELLRGELEGGGNIPRMAPFNTTLSVNDSYKDFKASLRYKIVDESRYEADNETRTKGYDWLSASLSWEKKLSSGTLELWLKGENLTDSIARNHLSFLKASAPLTGRQVSVGGSFKF
ncbi:MAG: TonB-dependent receptor [Epsilonproteobacteria bacterium]|nr:TonB-dependent receptor [Campylobacterota bacterium]